MIAVSNHIDRIFNRIKIFSVPPTRYKHVKRDSLKLIRANSSEPQTVSVTPVRLIYTRIHINKDRRSHGNKSTSLSAVRSSGDAAPSTSNDRRVDVDSGRFVTGATRQFWYSRNRVDKSFSGDHDARACLFGGGGQRARTKIHRHDGIIDRSRALRINNGPSAKLGAAEFALSTISALCIHWRSSTANRSVSGEAPCRPRLLILPRAHQTAIDRFTTWWRFASCFSNISSFAFVTSEYEKSQLFTRSAYLCH